MKKFLLLFPITIFNLQISIAQSGVWTWVSGVNTTGSTGVFGTQGIPSVNNFPPGVYEACDWKDKQGNFWLYGGFSPSYSDLWKFNPTTLEWTWVKGTGTTTQTAVYGILGVPDPANTPGNRDLGSATWVDTTGNFWLFGGNVFQNDLWRYDIGTNEWTWMGGSTVFNQSGVHGTQGIPSTSNIPGARMETACSWTDAQNNLWLFGGQGYDGVGGNGRLNDLMKYNISMGEWTWMKGSNTANVAGVFGIKGVASATNDPGGRACYTKFKDASGNFWIMGERGANITNNTWKYDVSTNEWTWMTGTNLANDAGIYNAQCVYDNINHPAARFENRSAVSDRCGRFWLFGGANVQISHNMNDLWIFDPLQNKWNWLSGVYTANQPGSYGVLGVPNATNLPPSRYGAIAWWGNDDKFYLFGGNQNNTGPNYSDVWSFTPDTNCMGGMYCSAVLPAALFTAPNHICPGECTGFNNLSSNATSYQWLFAGGSPAASTDANPQNICYFTPGQYSVTLIATNAGGSDTLMLNNYITVYPQPVAPAITQLGDTLFSSQGYGTYQWYYGSDSIIGATNYFYVATVSGNYNVVVTDDNGCAVGAGVVNVIAGIAPSPNGEGWGEVNLFPNPTTGNFEVKYYSDKNSLATFELINSIGQIIYREEKQMQQGMNTFSFSGSLSLSFEEGWGEALYLLKITSGENIMTKKIVIEK